jgi:hypothetical protein
MAHMAQAATNDSRIYVLDLCIWLCLVLLGALSVPSAARDPCALLLLW